MTEPITKTPFSADLQKAGLTPRQFAALTNTPPNTVYNWCRTGKHGRNAPVWAWRELKTFQEMSEYSATDVLIEIKPAPDIFLKNWAALFGMPENSSRQEILQKIQERKLK